MLKLALQPLLNDLKLEWRLPSSVSVVTLPVPLPSISVGEHIVVYGIFNGKVIRTLFNQWNGSFDSFGYIFGFYLVQFNSLFFTFWSLVS